jgi:subfamily B ATP-binding cassette protein HlyB/CyaB
MGFTMIESRQSVSSDALIWTLANLCQQHRLPFDATLFLQRHPPEDDGAFNKSELALAADELGFEMRDLPFDDMGEPAELVLPCVAFLRGEEAQGSAGDEPLDPASREPHPCLSPALILQFTADRVSFVESGSRTVQTCSRADLASRFIPMLHLFIPRFEPLRDEDGARALAGKPFGFSWFVPEFLRYRKVWRDILAASLALQLVGLITPLFTQVVIDKVVVHQSQSTLVAVGLALRSPSCFPRFFPGCGNTWCCTPATGSMRCWPAGCFRICSSCPCRTSRIGRPAP